MQKEQVKEFLSGLNKDNLNIIFFNYSLKKHWHSPLMLIIKLYYHLTGKPKIDHVCHISKFDGDNIRVFEANLKKGMIENDLFERLEKFEGNVYLISLGQDKYFTNGVKIDKNICRQFENEFRGKKYDPIKAVGSAVDDIGWIKKITKRKKLKGAYCSYLVSELMIRLGYRSVKFLSKEVGGITNIAPYELFNTLYRGREIQEIEIDGKIFNQKVEKRYATSTKNKSPHKVRAIINSWITKFLILLLTYTLYNLKIYNENLISIKKIISYNAYNYQDKENKILSAMSKSLEGESNNLYLGLLTIDKDNKNYNFIDIIHSSTLKTNFGDSSISIMREKIRKNFKSFCQISNNYLSKNFQIPSDCLDRSLPINTIDLYSVYGSMFGEYIIIASCYFEKCTEKQIDNLFSKIREELK